MIKVPSGFEVKCIHLNGQLALSQNKNIEFIISDRDAPRDDHLQDTIGSVEYTNIEGALKEFGQDAVKEVLEGRSPSVSAKVCIFKRK